ncbi:MAG: hypothetical protein EXQ52_01170 [Bryobacterales bacterium]|nr:hypothetical protein [Bryobacterales bacterium]
MSQLDEAISRYHKLLENGHSKDLSWVEAMRERMHAENLSTAGRLLCPFLRPHFLSRRQFDALSKTAETLIGAIERMGQMVLSTPALLARMELLPGEKMLASIDPGYHIPDVTARLDSHLNNGSLHLVQYSAESPSGLAWAEGLADIFYDCPPVKEFRKRYTLTRIGGKKLLLSALLKAFRQFAGKNVQPKIGILEFRPSFQSSAPSEYEIFRDFYRASGFQSEIVSPDQLEFRNGVLRRGNFEINLIHRRVSAQEFLLRFDLSHPLVQAYKSRAVCIVNSFRSELAHKKAMFGLLTDETLTAKFPAAERRAILDHVPWTRLVSPMKTTYEGETVDLQEFILKNQEKLVLKPNDEYGGKGAFFGWEMDASGWERALREAMRAPYVVQEKVEPAKAVFPLQTYGELEFREMRVDLHPHAYLGKIAGCASWLAASGAGGFSTAAGLAPTYILETK